MRAFVLLPLLCSFVLLSGGNKLSFNSISAGMNSTITEQKQDIIHSQKVLNLLWTQLHKTELMMADIPPAIDFKKKTVVACYAGDRAQGLRIDSVSSSGTSLVIFETKLTIGQGCDISSDNNTPFEIIVVDGKTWSIASAEMREVGIDCSGE